MDKSRGSSSKAVSDGKRRHEGSSEAGSDPDLAYEASLHSKLEAERVGRAQVERERSAWAAGPEWLQRDVHERSEVVLRESGASAGLVQVSSAVG